MEADGDGGKSEFLEKLKNYDGRNCLWNKSNLLTCRRYHLLDSHEKESAHSSIQQFVDGLKNRKEEILHGRDLGCVKHYNASVLIVNQRLQDYLLGNTLFGSFFLGSIGEGSDEKSVVVKTWDYMYPPRDYLIKYPSRLHNEIMLLTNDDLKSHPNLPKLIGYSIHNSLAAIYELKAQGVLHYALKSGDLGWDFRMKVATQVASLLKHFHGFNCVIGSIDSINILIDEENDIKLCEFGLTTSMSRMMDYKIPLFYTAGQYSHFAPELYTPGDTWTTKIDIFAFGYLLLELMTKGAIDLECLHRWALREVKNGRKSLVDNSLLDDTESGSKITELAMTCLNDDPSQRPDAVTLARNLEDLKQGIMSKKPKRGT